MANITGLKDYHAIKKDLAILKTLEFSSNQSTSDIQEVISSIWFNVRGFAVWKAPSFFRPTRKNPGEFIRVLNYNLIELSLTRINCLLDFEYFRNYFKNLDYHTIKKRTFITCTIFQVVEIHKLGQLIN